jgi:tetratricopeptide (TPR) repeat protein
MHLLGTLYHNQGALFLEEKKYDEALEASMKSYLLREKVGHLGGQVKTLISLGSIYNKTGKRIDSDTCYSKALKLAEEYGFIEDQAYLLMHLGFLQLENENFEAASGYFSNSMEMAKELNDLELQLQLHDYIYYIDSVRGDYQNALFHLQQHSEIQSSFNISDSDKKLKELESLYSLAKTENELKEGIIRKNRSLILCLTAGLVLVVLLTVLIVQQILLRSQRKIAELTQENLRSQMNPHFIFNILNSIHTFILNNDTKSSSNYLMKFSHLLRLTLDNSINKLAPINDELKALKLYLELEAMRFENKLEYEIIVDEEIDPLMFKIPTLLLQPYVENSIVHGLQNKEGKGKIEIRLDYQKHGIHCSITDNGIGRKRSEELQHEKGTKHKSHGSKIAETRLRLLNKIYGRKIGVSYSDILDENSKCMGTKVEFNLPILN